VISILLSPWHAAIYDYRLELVISILLSPWHAAICDYRLEPGYDIIYHHDTRRNLWLSPWTWWYRYYGRSDKRSRKIIIALNLVISLVIIALTHAVIAYTPGLFVILHGYYRLTRRNLWLSPSWWYRYYRLTTPQFMIIAWTCISILLSLDYTPQFIIIASTVISYDIALTHGVIIIASEPGG
jgi:hypothetical protein